MPNESTLKDFTRGGQTTMHNIRMFMQSIKYIVIIALFCSLLLWGSLFMKFSTPYQRYTYGKYLMAQLEMLFSDGSDTFVIEDGRGTKRYTTVKGYINHPNMKQNVKYIERAAKKSTYVSLGGLSGLLLLLVGMFMYRGNKHRAKDVLRGPSLSNTKTVKKLLKQQKRASNLLLADLPIIKDTETEVVK